MVRGAPQKSNAGLFFMATLVLWFVSVVFEIAFNRRTELMAVLGGTFFFQTANWVIRLWLSHDPLFVNTSVSLLHSTMASVSVVFILLKQLGAAKGSMQIFEHDNLVSGSWSWAYSALCLSCGYFAYDQCDMLLYRLYSGLIPAILVHHLILLMCFTLALYRNVTINYLILTLICELHSVFLHVRKLRRMAGIRTAESKAVKAEWILSWISFFFARIIPHVLITIKLIRDASKFDKGVEHPLALFGMFGMNLLNIGLGIDLFHAYKREKTTSRDRHTD
ncbi:hypothetical protein Nepgr_019007 [Nepenthes gracilis]|uniref:TLC domain-containing protein n=1 Tax=Nepenthes gracilis TaxID=150966 RepID=A0AAD3SW62_NEPGR|nr:hypothetical protein Nepgr_019007 [Nepenthes gracilis]